MQKKKHRRRASAKVSNTEYGVHLSSPVSNNDLGSLGQELPNDEQLTPATTATAQSLFS